MYELLDQHRVLKADCLDACPKLRAFMDRFEVCEDIIWHFFAVVQRHVSWYLAQADKLYFYV